MTTTAGTTLPTAPDLLIEAADTIGNRSDERDNADGERSMASLYFGNATLLIDCDAADFSYGLYD